MVSDLGIFIDKTFELLSKVNSKSIAKLSKEYHIDTLRLEIFAERCRVHSVDNVIYGRSSEEEHQYLDENKEKIYKDYYINNINCRQLCVKYNVKVYNTMKWCLKKICMEYGK